MMRFAKRQVYLGLDNVVTSDLGYFPEDTAGRGRRRTGRSRSGTPTLSRSRSRSPPTGPRGKRAAAPDEPAVRGGWGRRRDLTPPAESSYGRGGIGPATKRARMSDHRSPSPGPRALPGRRRPLSPPRRSTPPPMRDDYDVPAGGGGSTIPEGVLFLLGILPGSSAFNGPKLDPSMLMTVIGSTEPPLVGQAGPSSAGARGGHPIHPSRRGGGAGGGQGRRSPSPPPSAPARGRGGYGGARRGGGGGGGGVVRDRSPDYQRGSRPY
jgi:hypothetical protein